MDDTDYNRPMTDYESNEQLSEFQTLVDIVALLRAPGGCPWDREQTHESLKRNLLEEAHEALEAIDGGDPEVLTEETGRPSGADCLSRRHCP